MDSRFDNSDPRRLALLMDLESDAPASPPPDSSVSTSFPTTPQIEGYELVQQLGEGGMGVVWRAVQQSTHRTVALKLLPVRPSQRGRPRFDREIELAARLEHPNIARVYDSGASGGISYYAMELIGGKHLDLYVADNKLDVPQILELMLVVCRAVQYAHQRGVLHRDLKPSNILVTENGTPHVVDFGLAKALEDDADLALTRDAQTPGTPGFMSPEQAAGRVRDIDTRTDVYGLGATLYLLLTGQFSHDLSGSRYEVIRRIADEDVRRPRGLKKDLPLEIEWLLLRALAHDTEERYTSAAELAADIKRYLTGDPLLASPPSQRYRLRKFGRKHRAALSVAGSVLLLLIVATMISTWQAIRATRAEQQLVLQRDAVIAEMNRADENAAVAKAVGDFFNDDVLRQAGTSYQALPDQIPNPDLTVREALDRAAARVPEKFRGRPLVEAAVRTAIGEAYIDLGLLHEKAEPHLRAAVKLRQQSLGPNHPLTLDAEYQLGSMHVEARDWTKATEVLERVLGSQRTALGEAHPDTLHTMTLVGFVYASRGNYKDAEALCLQVLERNRAAGRDDDLTSQAAMNSLDVVYMGQRSYAKAAENAEKFLEHCRKRYGTRAQQTVYAMSALANAYSGQHRYVEAEALHAEGLRSLREVYGDKHELTLCAMWNMANHYVRCGEIVKAEPLMASSVSFRRENFQEEQKRLGAHHPDAALARRALASALSSRAGMLCELGKYADAEPLMQECVQLRKAEQKRLGPDHPELESAQRTLDSALMLRADILRELGKYADAEPLMHECVLLRKQFLPMDNWKIANARSILGETIAEQGKFEPAEAILLDAYRQLEAHPPPKSQASYGHEALERVVKLYDDWDKRDQADAWRAKLATSRPTTTATTQSLGMTVP